VYYDPNWKPMDQDRFAALQRDLVGAPRWIIDGNYASSLPIRLHAADTVIFLDLPSWICLCGVARRRIRYEAASTTTSVSTIASTGAWSGTSSATAAEWHPGSGS
jgi:adenylate kinase family enzyme